MDRQDLDQIATTRVSARRGGPGSLHRRAHLDLQVNLLAERELTAILKVVCLISDKVGVDITECDSNLGELLGRTDFKALSDRVAEELTAPDKASAHSSVSQT